MIGLWTGVPRSGKSYSLVYRIANKYCEKIGDTYYLKDEFVIISDIEGLVIDHYPVEDFLEIDNSDIENVEYAGQIQMSPVCPQCGKMLVLKKGQYGEFYSCDGFPNCKYTVNPSKLNEGAQMVKKMPSGPSDTRDIKNLISEPGFKRLREKFPDKKIVIIIDECQRYFHKRFYDREVFLGFEKHGHYGVDIYLIAHHIGKISREISDVLEFETRLVPRRFGIPGFFWYLEKQGRTVVGRGKVPIKQIYFNLYKSQGFEQGDKVERPFYKLIFLSILVVLIGVGWFYSRMTRDIVPVTPEKISAPVSPAPLSGSSKNYSRPARSTRSDSVSPSLHVKKGTYFSTPSGYIYSPVDTVHLSGAGKGEILILYEGNLIPLPLYPRKTVIYYSNGNPVVYELRKEQTKKSQTYKSSSFIGLGENNKQTQDDIDT